MNIRGVITVTPGNTAVVDLPWHNINSQTYTMINVNYSFNKKNMLNESVLRITVNQKVSDFVDIMKDQKLRMKAVETGALEVTLMRLETFTGDTDIDIAWKVFTLDVGSNFILDSPPHGILDTSYFGDGATGSQIVVSGGDF